MHPVLQLGRGRQRPVAGSLPVPMKSAFRLLLRSALNTERLEALQRLRRGLLGTSSWERKLQRAADSQKLETGVFGEGQTAFPSCRPGRQGAVSGTSRPESGCPRAPKSTALLPPGTSLAPCLSPSPSNLQATQGFGPGALAEADLHAGAPQQERKSAPAHLQSWSHTTSLSSRRAGHRFLSPTDT